MLGEAKQLRDFVQESDFPLHIKEALLMAIQLEISGSASSELSKLVVKFSSSAEKS